jgi:mono/diheme cytochrome c family protein
LETPIDDRGARSADKGTLMITVQDRIEIAASSLDRVLTLLYDQYREAATQRGLQFVEYQISPPVRLHDGPVTVWLRWQVADVDAWWAMRAQSGTPDVAQFWSIVDSLCFSRERQYLTGDAPTDLPGAVDISSFISSSAGYRETAQLRLKDSVDEAQRPEFETALRNAMAELPGLKVSSLSANYAPEYAAGHYTWDLLYADFDAAEHARQSAAWQITITDTLARYCAACHALRLGTISAGMRRHDLKNGIKRTAYFRLLPGTSADTAQRFERDLLEMPAQIPEILNWRLSRASSVSWDTADCAPWTYVWEQEFASLDDLLGPYMTHPHHWAHIDRWFDPESGIQAVDVQLSHAFSFLETSILHREMR